MGPDVLMSSAGGASIVPGSHSSAGLGRLASPTRQFLLNRRKWWCCGVRRRKKSSLKHNAVSFNEIYISYLILFRRIVQIIQMLIQMMKDLMKSSVTFNYLFHYHHVIHHQQVIRLVQQM
jgi:hypothetical protein